MINQTEQEKGLEYKGFFKLVNSEPDQYIEVFCSDWNKEHWAFYAFIDIEELEDDISAINDLIQKLNYRDGDVYIELINHSDEEEIEELYQAFYDRSGWDHSAILNLEIWEELREELESRPPKFTDGWEALEYLEEIFSKETLYDKFTCWIGGSELLQIYERIMDETL